MNERHRVVLVDHGIGMQAKLQEKVFWIFHVTCQEVHSTMKDSVVCIAKDWQDEYNCDIINK